MQISPLIITLAVFFSWATLSGQDRQMGQDPGDTVALEDVTISVLPFQEKYMEATGGVFVIEADKIRNSNSFHTSDLFNMAPGVHMASGSLNTNRVVIRGVGSRTPYNSNRIRAYLDDIPLTSGDGISTLEDLDMFSIGSMEVLKGPASALYGSGLGGVIRLNSPYPDQNGFRTTVSAEGGSFNTTRYGITTAYKKKSLALTGGLTRSSTNGYRENSDYQRTNAFVNAQYFGEKHSVSLTMSLVDLHSGIPSSLNETDFINDPSLAGGSWGAIKGFEEYVKLLSGIKVESRLGANLKNRFTLFSTYTNPYERRPFNILDEQSFNLGFRETLEYRIRKVSLSAGVEYLNEWFRWKIFETLPESQGPLQSDQSEVRRYLNGFTLVQWRPDERIVIDAGLNLNLLSYSLTTQYQVDSTDQSGSYNYKPVLSPRIGISYDHGKQIWTYAAAGHGFSAPSLEETLLPEGTINTSLRPETGWNLEIGNRGRLFGGRLEYDLALYSIFLNDLLVTERVSEDIFTGVNAGNALNTGLEILVKGILYPQQNESGFNSNLVIGYNISRNTFTDFVDEGTDYSGNHLPGIPMQELSTIINGSFHSFNIRIHHRYTGNQWMNDANYDKYEGYHLLHFRMNWKHQLARSPFHIMIFGGVRNILDTEYASMILINAPSFGGRAPRYYYPGAPRHFQLGLKLSYIINPT
jgi:iron complex outermembrane receptor protein